LRNVYFHATSKYDFRDLDNVHEKKIRFRVIDSNADESVGDARQVNLTSSTRVYTDNVIFEMVTDAI
jgi:hypothetical protein